MHEENNNRNSFVTCLVLPLHIVFDCITIPSLRVGRYVSALCTTPVQITHYLTDKKQHLNTLHIPFNQPVFVCYNGVSFNNFLLNWSGDNSPEIIMKAADSYRNLHVSSKTLLYEVLVRLMYNISNNIIVNLDLFRMVADTKVPTLILPFQKVLRCSYSLKVHAVSSTHATCCSTRQSTSSSIQCDLLWPRNKTPELSKCSNFTGCCHLSHVSSDSLPDVEQGLLSSSSTNSNLTAMRNLVENEKVILYLHGGAYVLCNTRSHRSLIYSICKRTECIVFAPNFRRPPEVDLEITIDDALESYLFLVNDLGVRAECITVMGESAGGALCLSLLVRLRALQEEVDLHGDLCGLMRIFPRNAVMVSPWVDLSACELNSASFVSNDNKESDMFTAEIVKRFANRISMNRSLIDPIVSPIYNELYGLPPLLVIAGERELLRDQIVSFAQAARQADDNNQITLQVYHEMCHAFLLFEFCHPTARMALTQVCRFIQST